MKNILRAMGRIRGSTKMPRGLDQKILQGRTFFVGLGAMKAGTSWLSSYLRSSPHVLHSPTKEMNFFNTLVANPLRRDGPVGRANRLSDIVLDKAWDYPPAEDKYEAIKSIAELGAMNGDRQAYLDYFARRISDQRVYGEISPSYALLPPQGYRNMVEMGDDVRLIFLMRDPTERVASNIQHTWRRTPDRSIDDHIDALQPGENIYDKSDYLQTLESVAEGAADAPLLTLIYEDLFSETSTRAVCEFLGIPHEKPKFQDRVNPSRGPKVSASDKERIREKLDPIYQSLSVHFGDDRPPKWRW